MGTYIFILDGGGEPLVSLHSTYRDAVEHAALRVIGEVAYHIANMPIADREIGKVERDLRNYSRYLDDATEEPLRFDALQSALHGLGYMDAQLVAAPDIQDMRRREAGVECMTCGRIT